MTEYDLHATGVRQAGYAALIARFRLDVIPNWHQSFVAAGNTHKVNTTAGVTEEIYPARYWPGDTLGDHLEFALKYDGTSLAILASVFKAAPLEEVQQAGRSEGPDGGIDRRPQADGRGNCAGRGPRRRRGVWIRLSASVRGR